MKPKPMKEPVGILESRLAHVAAGIIVTVVLLFLLAVGLSIWDEGRHFRQREDWIEYLARPKAGAVDGDAAVLDRALDDPEGTVITVDDTVITVLRRLA